MGSNEAWQTLLMILIPAIILTLINTQAEEGR